MKKDEISHHLSKQRSRYAAEQTLLAWIRTSLTLIGFGFGIPGIINVLSTKNSMAANHINALGSSFIILGLLGLVVALVQYRTQVKRISRPTYIYEESFHLAFFVAAILFVIGFFAFISLL